MDIVRAFIVGSSVAVFAPFVLGVSLIRESTILMWRYLLYAAFYFGAMNALVVTLAHWTRVSPTLLLILATMVSTLVVWVLITLRPPYHFASMTRWIAQYILVAIAHTFTFLVTLNLLDRWFGLFPSRSS